MPSSCKATAKQPQTVDFNRGPYSMKMEDGVNAEITMYGDVVETHPVHWRTGEPLEGDFIAQDDFLHDLDRLSNARTITIRMNSLGGDSLVGMVIHNRLRELSSSGTHLICIVDGAAMSAASVIMSACDEVRINPAGLVMIHRCWSYLWGAYNADELRKSAEMFDAYDRAAVTAYQRKTKQSPEKLLRMMSETTWLTGAEAVEKGFADKLIEDADPLDIAASADGRSLFVRGRTFHLAPGMFAPDIIPTVNPEAPAPDMTNDNQPAQTGEQNGGKTMATNLTELRAENPRLFEALMAEANAALFASGTAVPVSAAVSDLQDSGGADRTQTERQRLQEIDAVASLYDKETVWEAKYGEHPCTAQEMAYRAAQKAVKMGRDFLTDVKADFNASGAGAVRPVPPSDDKEGTNMLEQARADARAFNERGKEIR